MAFNSRPPKIERGRPDEFAALNRFLEELVGFLNGGQSITQNMSTRTAEVTFRGAAQEEPVEHGLGRVPEGFVQIGSKTASVVVTETEKARTEQRIYLQSDVPFAKVKLMFF